MKKTAVRQLKQDTTTVLDWVAGGESAVVHCRSKPAAVLSTPRRKGRIVRPDFARAVAADLRKR